MGVLAFSSAHAQENQESPAPAQSTEQNRVVPEDYAENYAFTDANDRKTFLKLTAELRCPKCQNQNIADSDAPIAHDMRRKVYQLMKEGNDEEQVIGWMKQRYGDFVHYQPPVNAVTMWLWLAPVLFAFIMLAVFIKRRKVVDDDDIEARLARAEQLLKEE
ncbi:cytochrome c-type biogenesis protein CcmH [Glaciecola sp. XM2]|nr:cytochrome c-type biogenesis protein CcmH [Glaciecola sp. XM2]